MPRVPGVQTLATERVRTAPLRIPLQRPSTVDVSGLGQGLVNFGTAIERANLQISQIKLSEAETEVVNRWNQRLFVDDDAFFRLEGRESVDAFEGRMQELKDIQNEVSNRVLDNNRDRAILANALNQREQQSRTKMALRSHDERQVWDKATALANINAQMESAANDPSVENLRLSRVRIEEEAATIARIDGMPPEQQAQAAGIAVSGLYRNAIEQSMLTDLNHAQSLFDRFGEDILSDDRKAIQSELKKHRIIEQGRANFERIRDGGGTLEAQLDMARKIKNTEVMDEAIRRLTNAFNQDEAARAEINRDAFQALGSDIFDGTITLDQIRTSAPDAWDVLTVQQKTQIAAIEVAVNSNKPIQTDWGRWSELTLMDPNDLAQIEPMNERLKLADKEFSNLLKIVKEARTGDPGFAFTQVVTPYKRLEIAAGGSKALRKTKGKLLTQELTERLEVFELDKGGKATANELDDIISALIVDVELPGTSFLGVPSSFPLLGLLTVDPDRKVFQIDIGDVPEKLVPDIQSAFQRRHGRLPNDNEITDLYGLKLQKDAE